VRSTDLLYLQYRAQAPSASIIKISPHERNTTIHGLEDILDEWRQHELAWVQEAWLQPKELVVCHADHESNMLNTHPLNDPLLLLDLGNLLTATNAHLPYNPNSDRKGAWDLGETELGFLQKRIQAFVDSQIHEYVLAANRLQPIV
jgi:hypothetical protein|tara:strand:- start:36891 stop:37328 length:438 start_codon:yes stop_codon:yes gene_type:complete